MYFLMLTLVLGQLVWALVLQWISLTKGTTGISGIKVPQFLMGFSSPNVGFYYFTLVISYAVVIGLIAINKSPFGLKLRGVRESESRMKMLGYNTSFLKWLAFMISSFVASLSGMFYVYYSGIINPDAITLNASNQVMIASIFGGVNSIFGAIIGTGIIKVLEIVLSGITQRYLLIIGILFLIVIVFAPKGVTGILESIWIRFSKDKQKSEVKD
ncbi:MAG: branched-chain amino acid ABC transporter permease [Peptococcaceae bacterium]|nr:branched-chain amino acid ABC transporter permease [Peptococcaceae bacterium]